MSSTRSMISNSTARYCPVIGITVDNIFSHSIFTGVIAVLIFLSCLGLDSDLCNRINLKLLH